jgi:hypothetical protein
MEDGKDPLAIEPMMEKEQKKKVKRNIRYLSASEGLKRKRNE